MIIEDLNRNWKITLARGGDASVFGAESDVRRRMDEEDALRHFGTVWEAKLEPELRKAPPISTAQAKKLVKENQQNYAVDGYQYRQFSLDSAVFVARLNQHASEDGRCDQLWPLGVLRDNTRLSMYFEEVAHRERFEQLAHGFFRQKPEELALSLAMDFLRKFEGVELP